MLVPACSEVASRFAGVLERVTVFENARSSGIASILVIAGNMYLRVGDGDSALRLFKQVDDIRPSTSSATRIAGLFLGAGEYAEARRALEVAIERDSASGISNNKMEEYVQIFERIDSELDKTVSPEEQISD